MSFIRNCLANIIWILCLEIVLNVVCRVAFSFMLVKCFRRSHGWILCYLADGSLYEIKVSVHTRKFQVSNNLKECNLLPYAVSCRHVMWLARFVYVIYFYLLRNNVSVSEWGIERTHFESMCTLDCITVLHSFLHERIRAVCERPKLNKTCCPNFMKLGTNIMSLQIFLCNTYLGLWIGVWWFYLKI